MKYIIAWIIILSAASPVYAYGSGDTIYVKRERGTKPSLLDRKFVIRTVASDIRSDSPATNITAMHQQLTIPKPITAAQASKPAKTVSKTVKASNTKVSSNNWSDFATESQWDESRDVSAKLIF